MKEKIFEDAKFGDKFLTRDGRIALFLTQGLNSHNKNQAILFVENEMNQHCFDLDGTCSVASECDIVSKYQEPINEYKLDEYAHNYAVDVSDYDEIVSSNDISAFKAGYLKAKEK